MILILVLSGSLSFLVEVLSDLEKCLVMRCNYAHWHKVFIVLVHKHCDIQLLLRLESSPSNSPDVFLVQSKANGDCSGDDVGQSDFDI